MGHVRDAPLSSDLDEFQEAGMEGGEEVEGEVETIEEHHFAGRIGMTFTVLEQQVVVIEADPEGDAAAFGVKPGDLICEVSAGS